MATASVEPKTKKLNQQEILFNFEQLRAQQKGLVHKVNDLSIEVREHELVISALKEVSPERKCFRMIGTVQVERTVKDVLPALIHNCEKLKEVVATFENQIEMKGKEINDFREKYDIKFKGEAESSDIEKTDNKQKSIGVLVGGNK